MQIKPEKVEAYLRAHGYPDAALKDLTPLGDEVQEGLKAHGYGAPLKATFETAERLESLVIRTVGSDPFGHDRRADRMDGVTLAYDTFNHVPRHIRAFDIGTFAGDGSMLSISGGEPFLITEFVEGDLYAQDLKEMGDLAVARTVDLDRAEALARYLAQLHSEPMPEQMYRRSIRDTVGHGEGVFGLTDSYAKSDEVATPARLEAFEHGAVEWRWRLREKAHRSCRTHGDFHPFNLLFRQGCDFSVLDASRGGAGEPADDVTCLSINYLFFALTSRGNFEGALREAWEVFYATYLSTSGDDELLDLVAPFFAWRTLVLASPAWYPNVPAQTRDRLLRFAEKLLDGRTFTPEHVDDLL